MADVLAQIIDRKRAEVAGRSGGRPVAAEPTPRSLRAALSKGGVRFIMEVKRRSPSGHRARHSLEDAVAAYAPVADAISVLVDGPDFGGSLDDLRAVRKRFAGPILAKDFIVDPAQVSEARAAGADAVLAMLSVLGDAEAARVLEEASRLAMDVVVEVHDEAELGRARALGAAIIGINNRDLRTLATDLSVTERLAPRVPAHVMVIAESGIGSHAHVRRLSHLVDAFLVGSSLMASADIAEAARALVHGRVKLCGLTRGKDVELAARCGATHAGFVLVPGTPRTIDADEAAELAAVARGNGLKTVAVVRDCTEREALAITDRIGLDALQLHGLEPPEFTSQLRSRMPPGTELWGLCGVGAAASPCRPGTDRTLFDTRWDGTSGGSGQPFDWSLVRGRDDLPSAFLAGGIGPSNAARAAEVGAYGLDVGSAVEDRPGIKDPARVAALFAALCPDARVRP